MSRRLLFSSAICLWACASPGVQFPVSAPATSTAPSLASSTSAPGSTSSSAPSTAPSSTSLPSFTQEGLATYYADSLHGRKTASGEPYDKGAMTCAHKKLPFGTYLLVESLTNGKSVVVRVNDRGPFSKSRIVDVSRVAAEQLDLIRAGVMKVKITVVAPPVE